MVRLSLFLLLNLVTLIASSAENKLKFCYIDHSMSPWITGANQGLVLSAIHQAEHDLNQEFELLRLPWKRCLNEVKEGRIQAAIGASYMKERTIWGSYPTTTHGALNKDLRLFNANFYLYRHMNSKVRWHNQHLEHADNLHVGVQLGYSVGRDLEKLGYSITYLPASDDLVGAFKSGMPEVIVLEEAEANRIMNKNTALKNTMIRDDEPIKIAEQYLLFNADFYNEHKVQVNTIWATLGKTRKSKSYQRETAKYLKPR
ncbi:hypothetical protein [Undibacterium sp. RuRC25W]|uniref:hypothetical protein n=1 Tax=Undibacterium sp. RuRC25W TaxID=3413047 RepID=UPI003BF35A6B